MKKIIGSFGTKWILLNMVKKILRNMQQIFDFTGEIIDLFQWFFLLPTRYSALQWDRWKEHLKVKKTSKWISLRQAEVITRLRLTTSNSNYNNSSSSRSIMLNNNNMRRTDLRDRYEITIRIFRSENQYSMVSNLKLVFHFIYTPSALSL